MLLPQSIVVNTLLKNLFLYKGICWFPRRTQEGYIDTNCGPQNWQSSPQHFSIKPLKSIELLCRVLNSSERNMYTVPFIVVAVVVYGSGFKVTPIVSGHCICIFLSLMH